MTDTNTEMVKATPNEVYVPRKTPEYLLDRVMPESFEDMVKLAELFAQSKMFGVQNGAQALSIIMIGLNLKLDVTTAMRGIFISQSGRPGMMADLQYTLVMRHPDCRFFRPVECSNTHSTWETQRGDDPPSQITVTWDDAVRAGLSGKDTYQKYPMDMLNAWCKRRLRTLIWADVTMLPSQDEIEDVEYIEGQASRPALSSPEPTPLPARVIEPVAPDLSGLRYRYQALVKELSPERKKLAAGKIKDVLGSTTPGDLGADQLDAAIKIVQEAGEGKYDAAPVPEVEPVAQPAMDLEPPKSAEPEPPKYEAAVLDSAGAPIDKAKLYGTIRNKQQLLSEAQNLALREIWAARYDGERNLLKLKIPQMQECLAEVDEALAGSEVDPFEDNLELGLDPEANS